MTAVISIHYPETTFLFIAIYINAPLLFTVHCSSFILFQAIHQGYTPKDTVIVQKNIVIYTIKYTQYIFYIDTDTVSVANHNIF